MKKTSFLMLQYFAVVLLISSLMVACGGKHDKQQAKDLSGGNGAAYYTEEADMERALSDQKDPVPSPIDGDTDTDTVEFNTEEYDRIYENPFVSPTAYPLSTFSVDVDRAAYANVRRYLNDNMLPPPDAVRIEELVNYFDYDYPQPTGEHPFSVNLELGQCPWHDGHYLVSIGLKGKEVDVSSMPPSNLVFLLDVSGSMDEPNKLPLLKQSFKLLMENLHAEDRVAIVVYAGAAGLVLPSTPCSQKDKVISAFEGLEAGGSTAGGEGINLAYKIAQDNFIKNGNNRVILATDGDFNVGESSDGALERLIEKKREAGVFLTVLGFGMGNYKDSKMEKLSNLGNGNYAYIDNILEAKKVLGKEIWGTLYTIAKDVKIQVEFNPAQVKGYRLIGYENRMLNQEDFEDDTKDAGDIGSGHTVTAIYEIIPAGSAEEVKGAVDLKYQDRQTLPSDEMMTVKLRYKEPKGTKSKLIEKPVKESEIKSGQMSANFTWAAAITEFGLILRGSQYKAKASFAQVEQLAKSARGDDPEGYRAEFIRLLAIAQSLSK